MDILKTAKELAALAQTGSHFATDAFDQTRYKRIAEIAAELMASVSDVSAETILAWSREEFGYATPKVDVRGFILKDGRVLLNREDMDDGRWTLPGGWADVNETPSEAVVREVEEETGYRVRTAGLLGVLDRDKQGHTPPFPVHVYKLFFHCEITGGTPRKTSESSESAFFPIDGLPELSLSRVREEQIRSFFDAVRSGTKDARYD